MTEQAELMDIANIGADFEVFAKSNIGSYLIERAKSDEIDVLRELAVVPPDDKDQIYKLQLKAAVRKSLVEYISEVIVAGRNAKFQLEENSVDY